MKKKSATVVPASENREEQEGLVTPPAAEPTETTQPADPARPAEAKKKNDDNRIPLIIQIIFVASLAVATSWVVKYHHENYTTPRSQEKNFNIVPGGFGMHHYYVVPSADSVLDFITTKTFESLYKFQIFDGEKVLTKDDLEYYEYSNFESTGRNRNTFKYNNLITVLTYINDREKIGFCVESKGAEPGSSTNYTLVVTTLGKKNSTLKLELTDGSKFYYWVHKDSEVTNEVMDDPEAFDAEFAKNRGYDDKNFESYFQLKAKRMPEPYIHLAETAMSYVINNCRINETARYKGEFDKNFTTEFPLYYFESSHVPLTSLEEQIFPMLVLSKYHFPEKVLFSWLRTINERNQSGHLVTDGLIELAPIQMPMFFQFVKESMKEESLVFLDRIVGHLEIIAERTYMNSVGEYEDPVGARWLGHSHGLFGLHPATPEGESSFELFCLLQDMCDVMDKLYQKFKTDDFQKWRNRRDEIRLKMDRFFDEETQTYGDIVDIGKFRHGPSDHSAVILGLPKTYEPLIAGLLEKLETDPLYTPVGLQLSEEYGAPVSTNFMLLRSLRKYSALAGKGQEKALAMYSSLKNNLIAATARANRPGKSFYGRFARDMTPLGPKGHLDGTLVILVMAEDA